LSSHKNEICNDDFVILCIINDNKLIGRDGLFPLRDGNIKLESGCMSGDVLWMCVLGVIGVKMAFLFIRRFYFIVYYIKG
jgi:hypothetical protein